MWGDAAYAAETGDTSWESVARDAIDEIERLTEENNRITIMLGGLSLDNKRLRAALLEYSTHRDGCYEGTDLGDGMCNCGLSEALAGGGEK